VSGARSSMTATAPIFSARAARVVRLGGTVMVPFFF